MTSRERERRVHFTVLVGLVLLLAWLSFKVLEPFLNYLLAGLLLTYAFYPLYKRTRKVVKSSALSAFLVLLVITTIIVLPLFFVTWSLVGDIRDLSRNLTEEDVNEFFHRVEEGVGLSSDTTKNTTADGEANATADGGDGERSELLQNILPTVRRYAASAATSLIGLLAGFFIGIFLMAFTMYYGFKDGEALRGWLYEAIPLKSEYKEGLFREVRSVIDAVFVGHIAVSIIQGILGGIGWWLFGLPNPVFWGFVMTILAILPIVGTPIVWLPAGIIMLALGNNFAGIGILLWGGLIVSTIDNVLKPKIIGNRAKIHPGVVLVGVMGGLAFLGFIGFVIGPVLIAVFLVVLRFLRAELLTAQGEPTPPPGALPPGGAPP